MAAILSGIRWPCNVLHRAIVRALIEMKTQKRGREVWFALAIIALTLAAFIAACGGGGESSRSGSQACQANCAVPQANAGTSSPWIPTREVAAVRTRLLTPRYAPSALCAEQRQILGSVYPRVLSFLVAAKRLTRRFAPTIGFLVGRDRIELSTQGFSVLCSTD